MIRFFNGLSPCSRTNIGPWNSPGKEVDLKADLQSWYLTKIAALPSTGGDFITCSFEGPPTSLFYSTLIQVAGANSTLPCCTSLVETVDGQPSLPKTATSSPLLTSSAVTHSTDRLLGCPGSRKGQGGCPSSVVRFDSRQSSVFQNNIVWPCGRLMFDTLPWRVLVYWCLLLISGSPYLLGTYPWPCWCGQQLDIGNTFVTATIRITRAW